MRGDSRLRASRSTRYHISEPVVWEIFVRTPRDFFVKSRSRPIVFDVVCATRWLPRSLCLRAKLAIHLVATGTTPGAVSCRGYRSTTTSLAICSNSSPGPRLWLWMIMSSEPLRRRDGWRGTEQHLWTDESGWLRQAIFDSAAVTVVSSISASFLAMLIGNP